MRRNRGPEPGVRDFLCHRHPFGERRLKNLKFKHIKYFLLTFGIIAIDQVVKLLVHHQMVPGSRGEVKVFGDWFKLHYILNEGMAFGIQFAHEYAKLGLTLFRLVAVVFMAIYLYRMAMPKASSKRSPWDLSGKGLNSGLLWCIALILGGAIGNVIDSTFYGLWLNNAPPDAITPWFHGKVIDMFYLDLWEGFVADWVPFWGGKKVALLPIFNLADAAIFTGIFMIPAFQKINHR